MKIKFKNQQFNTDAKTIREFLKETDQEAFSAALIAKVNGKYRIAVGARPMVAALAHKAMEYLNNLDKISELHVKKAAEIASEELQYLDNKDASKEYRLDLTKVYVRRGLEEVSK